MKVVGIIQTRLNSSRFPKKALAQLAGKSMLQNVVERVSRAKLLNDVIVAPPFADFEEISKAVTCEVKWYAGMGEENDLINRIARAATGYLPHPDLIIRICADNPCIEPEAIDLLIEHGNLGAKGALVTNAGDYRVAEKDFGWPDGIGAELYTMEMLEFLNFEISKPLLREHPHRYYHDTHNIVVPPCPPEWASNLILDVNTHEDFEAIERVYNHFGNNEFHITDIIKMMDK